MISIRGTLPKGLLAHVVFIPNKYLIFRGAVRLTKPFLKQDYVLRSWKNVEPEARRRGRVIINADFYACITINFFKWTQLL